MFLSCFHLPLCVTVCISVGVVSLPYCGSTHLTIISKLHTCLLSSNQHTYRGSRQPASAQQVIPLMVFFFFVLCLLLITKFILDQFVCLPFLKDVHLFPHFRPSTKHSPGFFPAHLSLLHLSIPASSLNKSSHLTCLSGVCILGSAQLETGYDKDVLGCRGLSG